MGAVLIQDLGFLGGVGTDPNSMIPFIMLGGRRLPGPDQRPRRIVPRNARPAPGLALTSGEFGFGLT